MAAISGLIRVMERAARKAGGRLRRDFGEVEHLQVSRKGPADFVSKADMRSERTLYDELLAARPGWGFVMEEAGVIEGDPGMPRWIVDPLDGTSNFLHGIPHFCISIAVEEPLPNGKRDITTALGRSTDDGGIAAELSLDQVDNSIGYIVGKKVGLPDGTSITFDLTGPVTRKLHVRVDGKAKAVDHLDAPDVVVATDSTTFIQLASGRIDPQAQIDAGRIRWTGDGELGDRAARNLRFTM